MSKCRYNLSENCNNTDCLNCVLDKIIAEIEHQERWLMYAGYNAYNVNMAFSSIKLVIDKYKAETEE